MKNNYGEKFREERIRLKLKQSEVAKKLGCSEGLISYSENETRQFRVAELYTAYEFFGIDVGFGRIFEWIDDKSDELLVIIKKHPGTKFFEKELKDISKKNYRELQIPTLEKIDKILVQEENEKRGAEKKSIKGRVTLEEQRRLNQILKQYLDKDGNIERVLKLLEIAMQ